MAIKLAAKTLLDAAETAGDLSAYAIARRTGVSQSTLSRVLAGRVEPSLPTLIAIRTAYGTSLDDLVPMQEVVAC